VSTGDSLILGDVVELLLGGQVSAHPLCPGASMVLAPGFDRGAGVPRTLEISSLLLDGSTISGRKTDNRTFSLPIKISAPTRALVNGARELLLDIVDQEKFRLQWTPDPQTGTALPLIFECFRGTGVPAYDQDMEDQLVAYVTLTFPARPFGRSADFTTLAFPAPALSWSAPPTPVRVDDYSTVSSSTNPADWSQSAQAIDDSFSARWSAAGASTFPAYTRTLGASVSITGLDRLSFNFGLGTSTYNDWHGGRVTFAITITDNAAHTLSFGGHRDVSASNDPNYPNFQPVTFQIPASATFSFANVTAYSIKAWRRVTWFNTQDMEPVDTYLNGLTASASAAAVIPLVRGTTYRIGAPGGTARALMAAQFQPPAPIAGSTITYPFTTPGTTTFVPGLGQTSGKVRAIGASGIGGTRTTTGVAGGAGGGATAGHDTYPMTPGQPIAITIGAAGTRGGFPTLAASYFAAQDSSNANSLVTPSFTPSANDVLVIKAIVSDGYSNFGSPSGGGLTWTSRVNIGPTGTSRVGLWTATVGGSPSAMTVTLPHSGYPLPHGMLVERWTGAKLAGSPAVASSSGSGSAPSATCTTVAAQSVVSWVNSDHSIGTGARTYRSSATEDSYHVVSVPFSGYTGYWAWQTAAAAGAQTCGLTAPASQVWELAGVEIQAFTAGALTDGGDTLIDGTVRAAGGKSVPDNTTTGGLGGTVAASVFPAGGFAVRGGNGFTAVTTGGGAGSSAGTDLVGVDAAGQAGATAPAGGGSGGGGGNAGGNNPGTAGSAPGGGGGGAVSVGGTAAGGAGQPGKVLITTTPAITPIKTLLVHAPGYNAPATFSPLIPVGAGLDPPDGREYPIPSPVEGLNARYSGTHTIATFWSNIDTPSASRTHTVAFKQYDYPGGPSTTRSAARTLTPNTESPAIINGVVIIDTITLPCRDLADDQTAAYTTVGVTSTNANDRCLDVAVIDVTGQLLLLSHATGFPNLWWDPPEGPRDWGRILGSPTDRSQAVSVLDAPLMVLSGGPLIIDPDGPGWLLCYSPDAGAPALTAGFWAAWRDSRLS
jgi:hypothetical protein